MEQEVRLLYSHMPDVGGSDSGSGLRFFAHLRRIGQSRAKYLRVNERSFWLPKAAGCCVSAVAVLALWSSIRPASHWFCCQNFTIKAG